MHDSAQGPIPPLATHPQTIDSNHRKFVFTQDWFHTYIREDWTRLTSHLGNSRLRILEIGAFEGTSTVWMLENLMEHPKSSILVVDTFEGGMEHHAPHYAYHLPTLYDRFRANVDLCPHAHKLEVRRMRSETALLELRRQAAAFDLIYIDGSHVAMDVLTDAVLAWPMLAMHGTLVFDDWRWRGYLEDCYNPRIAIQSFLYCAAPSVETNETEYQMWVTKVENRIAATANEGDPEVRYWDDRAGLQLVVGVHEKESERNG